MGIVVDLGDMQRRALARREASLASSQETAELLVEEIWLALADLRRLNFDVPATCRAFADDFAQRDMG